MKARAIEEIVHNGFLPRKELSGWRSAEGEEFPSENTAEITVFRSFYECGFGVPTSDFFRRLIAFYGVELQQLTPISILHISIFVHLCEAYLGIDPHWGLFRHFFRLKITSGTHSRSVGRAGFQFRQFKKAEYISYTTSESVKEWYKEWFYVLNHAPKLAERRGYPPKNQYNWFSAPSREEESQVPDLKAMIKDLKDQGLTGDGIFLNFLLRRTQPLQQRCNPSYAYLGVNDPSRSKRHEVTSKSAWLIVRKYMPKASWPPAEVLALSAATITPEVREQLVLL